jgi:hypothetical protein
VIVPVKPEFPDENIGILPVAESGVNFKTTITYNGTDYADIVYANGTAYYPYTIEIENIGGETAKAASVKIDFNPQPGGAALLTDATAYTVDTALSQSIPPGGKVSLNINLACSPILDAEKEFEVKPINVTVTDNLSGAAWNDSVSARFYRRPVDFNIRSNKPVQGVIITPSRKARHFKTEPLASVYGATITLPWSPDPYLMAFIGADAAGEAFYSFAFDDTPDTNFTLQNVRDNYNTGNSGALANYEPNNTDKTAWAVETGLMSYLDSSDPYDYYAVCFKPNAGARVTFGEFTDMEQGAPVLIHRGASKTFSIDSSYGNPAWYVNGEAAASGVYSYTFTADSDMIEGVMYELLVTATLNGKLFSTRYTITLVRG